MTVPPRDLVPATVLPSSAGVAFVGRTAERQSLLSFLAEAGAGEPRLCLIRGEPGVGKSRLALEFLAEADAAGWQTLKGRCLEDEFSPLAPFLAEVLPRLRQAGILKGRAGPASKTETITDGVVLAGMLCQLAAIRPVTLLIDDIQLLAGAELTFFRNFCMALSDVGRNKPTSAMVVATVRIPGQNADDSDTFDRLLREPIARVIDLAGLGQLEANELVRRMTGSNCDPLLLEFFSGATRGNPLFLGEALQELSARGALSHAEGSLHATVNLDNLVLPASAPAVIRQRIARLPAEVAPVLELAALLGEEFSVAELAAVAGTSEPTLPLDTLALDGVLLGDGERYRFSHALVRQAVVEGIAPARGRALHKKIAEALAAMDGADAGSVLRIAEHRAQASTRDDIEAARFFEKAGDVAMEAFAWSLGARYYARAAGNSAYLDGLGTGQRGQLLAQLARANVHCSDLQSGRRGYEEAIPLLREAGLERQLGIAILSWERTYSTANETSPFNPEADSFLASSSLPGHSGRVALLAHRAEVLWLRRDPADEAAIQLALDEASALQDPLVRAQLQAHAGQIHMRHLRPRESIAAFRDCIRETETERNPEVRGWGRARVALPLAQLGEIEHAFLAAEESLRESLSAQAWGVAALNLGILACLDALRDGSRTAQRRFEFGSIVRERSRYPLAGFFLDSAAATMRLRAGELDEAKDAVESWQRTAGRYLARPMHLAVREAIEGPDAIVLELKSRPFRPLSWSGIDFSAIGSLAAWTDLANATQSIEIAEALFEPLKSALAAGIEFSIVPPALLSRCAITVATLLGHYTEADSFVSRAETIAAQSGARVEVGLVHLAAAELLVARGGAAEAIADRAVAARRVFTELDLIREAGRAGQIVRDAGRDHPLLLTLIPDDELSGSELAVLTSLANGLSTPQTATSLFLSERTVSRHLHRITLRLGIRSRDHAIQFLGSRKETVTGASPSPSEVRSGLRAAVPLSRREKEVLERIALGRTNQQIADELFISLYTVVRHVANIFDKTGSANRTEAARFLQ